MVRPHLWGRSHDGKWKFSVGSSQAVIILSQTPLVRITNQPLSKSFWLMMREMIGFISLVAPLVACVEAGRGVGGDGDDRLTMDIWWVVTLIATIATALVAVLLCKGRRGGVKPRCRLPPGSTGWPLFGETMEFISAASSGDPESFMNKRRIMYGKLFKSHIFGSPTIVSTDAEVNRLVLQSDASTFAPSYPRSLTQLMGKSSILLINGNIQRKLHGLIGSFLKSAQLKSQVTHDMQNYVQQAMDMWRDGEIVYLQDELKNITFQVLAKALISLHPGEEMEFLKRQFHEFMAGLISFPVNLPGSTLHRSLQARKRMVKLVQKIVKNRRNNRSTRVPEDVLDVLLSDTSDKVTDDLISDNIIDLMIPGEDSVPVLITLAVKYLSECPPARRCLKEENMKLRCGKIKRGEHLHWSDYTSLPFTQNVITETLRMGSVIVGVMRKAVKDVRIRGFLIPRNWCVLAYFRSVHLDDGHYESASHFNPWRWQDKDTSSCHFTPFGGGQRFCPGADLARLEASIFLHHLVTRFTWEAEEDTIVNFPTVRMKRKMPVRLQRRCDPHFGPQKGNTSDA